MNRSVIILIVMVIICIFAYLMSGGSKPIFKNAGQVLRQKAEYSKVVYPADSDQAKEAGEGVGVSIATNGDIAYLHRSNAGFDNDTFIEKDVVIFFDKDTLEVKNAWGKNMFIAPHGLHIDQNDHVWITDTELNQVMKFDLEGNLLHRYGENYGVFKKTLFKIRGVLPNLPIFMSKTSFAKPTDITVLSNGNFCVSDGYRNSRIVMFDSEGNFLWEKEGLGSQDNAFNIPHGISSDDNDNVYVADRSNGRIQIFDANGVFLNTWNNPELIKPFGICVKDSYVFVADGGEYLYGKTEAPTSQIMVFDLSGKIVDRFSYWGSAIGEVMIPHDIAVDDSGRLFIAELNNRRLQMMKWSKLD